MAKQKNLQSLMFVARDGYTLQRVFNIFNHDIKNEYVYASRLFNLVCRLDYRVDASDVAVAQQRTIVQYFCAKDKDIASMYAKYDLNTGNLSDFIKTNIKQFQILADSEFKLYKSYINEYILEPGIKNIGMVDTITENYSAQNLINSVLDDKTNLYGLYWYATNSKVNKHLCFFDAHTDMKPEYINKWNFMEFLMTSPEYPIAGMSSDFKPIYKQSVSDNDRLLSKIYPDISQGAVDFAKYISDVFGSYDIFLTYDTIVKWINCFFEFPTKADFKYIGQIHTSSNPNSDYYTGLFRDEIPFKYRLLHPIKYYKKMKSFVWHTFGEKIILNLTHPVRLRIHGLKNIKIQFFPKIKTNVINVSIGFGANTVFGLCVGSETL